AALVAILSASALLAACGSGGATVGGPGSSSSTEPVAGSTTAACGEAPIIAPNFVDGADANLSEETKRLYSGYPGAVRVSPYADMEAKPGPWRIGFTSLAPRTAWDTNLFKGMAE